MTIFDVLTMIGGLCLFLFGIPFTLAAIVPAYILIWVLFGV